MIACLPPNLSAVMHHATRQPCQRRQAAQRTAANSPVRSSSSAQCHHHKPHNCMENCRLFPLDAVAGCSKLHAHALHTDRNSHIETLQTSRANVPRGSSPYACSATGTAAAAAAAAAAASQLPAAATPATCCSCANNRCCWSDACCACCVLCSVICCARMRTA